MIKFLFKKKAALFFIPLCSAFIFFVTTSAIARDKTDTSGKDSRTILPNVFNENHGDLVESKLRQEAVLRFPLFELPQKKDEWFSYRVQLKNEIIKKTSALVHQNLPLNLKETKSLKMKGYTVKNITFQT